MNTQEKGILGQVSIVKYFVMNGYEVFSPVGDNASCDLIVLRDGAMMRVECKATEASPNKKSWSVSLRQVRPNRTENKVKNFDASKSDLLAVYIIPEDRVEVVPSYQVDGKTCFTVQKLCMDT